MIPVRTMPKFKCEFCKKRSTRAVMEIHEKRCFRNPNRFCDRCENTGKAYEMSLGGHKIGEPFPCPYCARFDKKLLAEIEAAEAR